MTDLTEQWSKGELPYGRYYVELAYNGNNIIMAEYWWDKALTLDDHEYSKEEVKQILAKVPNYTEWQTKDSQIDYLQQKVSVLESKNQQLKELLKECKSSILFEADVVREISGKHSNDYKMLSDLLTRINSIIGEIGN